MNTVKEYLLFDPLSIEAFDHNENHYCKLKFQAKDIVSIGIISQNLMHLVQEIIDNNPQGQRQLIGLILALFQILFFITNKILCLKLMLCD